MDTQVEITIGKIVKTDCIFIYEEIWGDLVAYWSRFNGIYMTEETIRKPRPSVVKLQP